MKGIAVSAVGVALWVAACGGESSHGSGSSSAPPGTVSCTQTQTVVSGSFMSSFTFCNEASGLTADQMNAQQRSCDSTTSIGDAGVSISGTYSDGPCSRANTVVGCRVTSGSFVQTVWFYADDSGGPTLSRSDFEQICTDQGGTPIDA